MKRFRYIVWILAVLLMMGGMVGEMWAAKVTYHILTLPIPNPAVDGNYDYHMKSEVVGYRLEAVKVVVENQTTVELPAHYKSPLATDFTYYEPKDIDGHGSSAISLYQNTHAKGVRYKVRGVDNGDTPVAVAVTEGTSITTSTAEYYVVYTYDASNGIAQLDGSQNYNIGVMNKGFLALNRGRNNRPAIIPKDRVNSEMLASEDFSYVDLSGDKSGISTYWADGNNKNPRDSAESKFFFGFTFEGKDPYHIVIKTTYARNYTYIEKNEGTNDFVYKWFKDAVLMAATTGNVYLASDDHKQYTKKHPTEPNTQTPTYDATQTGYFHGNKSTWSTVALLNNTANTGYVLMGTRTVDGNGVVPGPKDKTKYYYLKFTNSNNLTFGQIDAADATKNNSIERFYPLKKVTFKIATPFYAVDEDDAHILSAEAHVSQYTVDNDPIDVKYLPESLQRKYCNFTGKFYRDPACTEEITNFSDVTYNGAGEGYSIYVGYELTSTIPFKVVTPASTYDSTVWNNATWYELTDEGSTEEYGRKIKNNSGTYKNNGASGMYEKTSEFAFVGDPYELKVLDRSATAAAPTTGAFVTLSTHDTWDIPEDNAAVGSFLLRKYNDDGYWYWDAGQTSIGPVTYGTNSTNNVGEEAQTVTITVNSLTGGKYYKITTGGADESQIVSVSPEVGSVYPETGTSATITVRIAANSTESSKTMTVTVQEYNDDEGSSARGSASVITITQGTSPSSFAGNTVGYNAVSSTRVRVLPLPQVNFTYNIVDTHGNIAIKGTVKQTIFSHIAGFANIPEVIRSPFLADETITYYRTFAAGTCSNPIVETSNTDGDNIYVKYTTSHLATKSIKLDDTQQFKVKLNEEHIYYSKVSSKILSAPEVLSTDTFSWGLEGQDPYAMKICNVGNSGKYVKVDTWADDAALDFVTGRENGSRFIAMMSIYTGVYEVLAATGTTDYYHIGRPSSEGAETKMYSTATYKHGADQLRFELAGTEAIQYHLIDLAEKELLIASSFNPRLTLPADYVSPLVKEYYYYPTKAKALTNLAKDRITEPVQDTDESGGASDNNIYVRYVANDVVTFNTGAYMIRFLDPAIETHYLEDGNDELTATKLQPVYPYCNGDGNLNIYDNDMQKEQFGGGASTRPRWVWFFESDNKDPYHVSIRSKSTINYNSVKHPTYLTTYAVRYYQDGASARKHIVTGGTLPGLASVRPTEYMVLGTPGNYHLMTTDLIDDGVEKRRCRVDSLEQYWKTYNMIKLHVLGISNSTDAYSEDESTWVVPTTDDPATVADESTYRTTLASKGWHSYEAYANATRWNGYNDKSNGHEKKVVEKLEHWFQTFDMGNGSFDIEIADVPPVLVLLDRHGWEVMRRPLPTTTYPVGEELAELRVYDSPLVDKYYFYSNATKASGCHKYTLRLNDKKEERDQIKVNGKHYSSTSLADLPPRSATGVVSDGAIQDFYVTYSVKEEYEHNYSYSLDKSTTPYTESGKSQPYLVLQNGRFYKTENKTGGGDDDSYISKPIFEYTNPSGGNVYDLIVSPTNLDHTISHPDILDGSGNFIGNIFWYVKPNLNIDEEMGIPWIKVTGAATEAAARDSLRKEYEAKTGFDPYNIQLQLKNKNNGTRDGRFLTVHMTSTRLDNGILMGDYSGSGGKTLLTLEDSCVIGNTKSSEGYDHTTMHITNQTFMAVSDVNGNMQLMPRFDHTKRVSLDKVNPWLCQLYEPEDHAKATLENNESMGRQTTFFVCPKRYHYHIIDNNGREALRYQRGADFYPEVTQHFKSPLAKNFTYYTGLAVSESPVDTTAWGNANTSAPFKRTLTDEGMLTDAVKILPYAGTYYYQIGARGRFSYKKVVVSKGLLEQQVIGSFSETEVDAVDRHIYVRYEYDIDADMDADRMLQGQWYTVKLAQKDMKADGTIVIEDNKETLEEEVPGTGVNLLTGTKPNPVDADAKEWQWKFLAAPTDPSSDYYVEPDPYAVQLYNRSANYTKNPSELPSPMAVGIRVKNEPDRPDRFAVLSHPSGGYAFVVAQTYTDYTYRFINGENMSTTIPADTVTEGGFTYKVGGISNHAQILLGDTVKHTFTYRVLNNDSLRAITVTQTEEEAETHRYAPYLPEAAQSPLLNMEDYKYYGFARPGSSSSKYGVIDQTILYTLSGLYDDTVYVRYDDYDMDKTSFKVPNKRNATGTGTVARDPGSVDVSMNINHGLPYNIIWEGDEMMQSANNTTVSGDGSQGLSGSAKHIWYFTGGDPYALNIQHKNGGYLDGDNTMSDEAGARTFMLLRKTGYDYGVLQLTGDESQRKLTGVGDDLTPDAATDPQKFIIFGLSIHDLIYHLVIAKSCPDKSNPQPGEYVDIPYRTEVSGEASTKRIYGTTQRDLETKKNAGHEKGSKYQLGDTVKWNGTYHTYSYHAGSVSIGDDLEVPNVFSRPNCTFDFYVEGIYTYSETPAENDQPLTEMNDKYQGLKRDKLMSDEGLIDKTVVINIVYSLDNQVATNTGLDFVTSKGQNLWYTFETHDGATPYLAQYTNAWGLQSKRGRETRYTNDYLWTPLGDVYGFKMYNRYMLKNTSDGADKVMTMNYMNTGDTLFLAEPGVTTRTKGASSGTVIPKEYAIFELVSGDMAGYFRVHPVANLPEETQLYVYRDPTANNYTKLSTTPSDWRYGLDMDLLSPYYERAGYVGGLTPNGKAAYELAMSKDKVLFTDLQEIVYDDDSIVQFTPGYYRLHNQPGVSGIAPVRYASGYLHALEKDVNDDKDESDAIPMHFYSRSGVSSSFYGREDALVSGFTETVATRGEIPIDSTEVDPSTIFYLNGARTGNTTISEATMSTQGLNVLGNKMTTGDGTTFTLIDIGGATLLITDKLDPATRQYLNFDQSSSIYDLKFMHEAPTDDAKWCLQPVQKTATAGDNEMPLQIITHNGGDGYYYATFYAPFDVLLPDDDGGMTYNAYTCSKWYSDAVHPTPVPAVSTYAEGKFVPAGTPVIIRVKDESGVVTLTLPNNAPSSPESRPSCVFKGQYLEQLLAVDAAHDVYTLGVPMTSEVSKDVDDYGTTGDITAPLADFAANGVGFYINATPNKEISPWQSLWQRNNRYVQHNKIYYRAGNKAGAPEHSSGAEYVPVLFGDEEPKQPDTQNDASDPIRHSQKILYNGQLFILHEGKVYSITGQAVR